jgi:hypothetical protein
MLDFSQHRESRVIIAAFHSPHREPSKSMLKNISTSFFAVVVVCFFLPFVTISCQSQPIATITGLQLATGTTVQSPSLMGEPSQAKEVAGDPLTALAFVCAPVGIATTLLLKREKQAVIPAGIGGFGALLMLFTKARLDDAILKQGQAMLQLNYGLGFWLSFLLFAAAAGVNGYRFAESGKEKTQLPKS